MVNRSEGAPGRGGRRSPLRRVLGLGVVGVLAATLLSACGEEGKPTLHWYVNPDGVDTFQTYAKECSTDQYDISVELLPSGATDQRIQLARRLAAEDSSTDLMNLDPVFVAEFANAEWLAEIPGDLADEITGSLEGEGDYLAGAADTVVWEDKPFAIPLWANTQVLWYRKSLAEAAGLELTDPAGGHLGAGDPGSCRQQRQRRGPGQQVRGLRRADQRARPGCGRRHRVRHRGGPRHEGRHQLRGRQGSRRGHQDAGRLTGRSVRPLGVQRGHQPGPDVPGRPRRAPGCR